MAEPEEKKFNFVVAEKKIKSPMNMTTWQHSETYYDLLGFINTVCQMVQGKRLTDNLNESEPVKGLLQILAAVEQLAIDTPPVDQPQRFGNMAYRTWHKKMLEKSSDLIGSIVPDSLKDAVKELEVYFTDSFGNATRIDYGTGHELNFIMFLMALFKIGVLKKGDEVAAVLKVFDTYLNFARKLQVTYRMEPAGSHGVWSLDDFQFIPFVWGSAQLAANGPIEPSQFVEEETINTYRKQYMFISCIDYIQQVKTGHFAEHSNQLWSISAVPTWSKICTGLIKMYQKEVLAKFPVIQHVYFGSLFTLNLVKPGTPIPQCRLGMMPPSDGPKLAMGPPK